MKNPPRFPMLTLVFLLMWAPARAQQPAPGASGDTGSPLQWISVVLLVGQTQETPAGADEIPAAVRSALAEVRDFLPFRHFRMYDAALVGPPRTGVTNAWLRGTGSQVVEARIGAASPIRAAGPYSLHFTLLDPGESAPKSSVGRTLMSSAVTLGLGETIVVGTSRLRGDTALIVLLTAVPAKR